MAILITDRQGPRRVEEKTVQTQQFQQATTVQQQVDYERGLREWLENTCQTKPETVDMVLRNRTLINLVKHLRRHTTGSPSTVTLYLLAVRKFSQWVNSEPDKLLFDCYGAEDEPLPKMLVKHAQLVDDFVGHLQDQGLSPASIVAYVAGLRCLYSTNKLKLQLSPYKRVTVHPNRSPTPEQLEKVLAIGDLYERVLVTCLALGGFRIGTLSKLTHEHVKHDLETGVVPILVTVDPMMQKGEGYETQGYYTFLGAEPAEYLKAYFDQRRRGTDKLPPETISDSSPLIRARERAEVQPVSPEAIWKTVNNLYHKAGLIAPKETGNSRWPGPKYTLRPHSLRYYFRTQLTALGVSPEYAEFMLGHKTAQYNDIRMKGPEFLRAIYATANPSIRQRTRTSKLDLAKAALRALDIDPDKVLVREAFAADPHRLQASPLEREEWEDRVVNSALKQALYSTVKQYALKVSSTPEEA